jgi:hypothetical protein
MIVQSTAKRQVGRGRLLRSLTGVGGLLVLVVTLNALIGLFGLYRANERHAADLEQSHRVTELVDGARSAQVAFKIQVQEWKNILLRGRDPADYAQHLAAFELQAQTTLRHLDAVVGMAGPVGFDTTEPQALHQVFIDLGTRYREALAGFDPARLESAVEVDRAVRGIDRSANQRLDKLTDDLLVWENRLRADIETRSRATYDEMSWIIHLGLFGAIVLSLFLLFRMSRSIGRG